MVLTYIGRDSFWGVMAEVDDSVRPAVNGVMEAFSNLGKIDWLEAALNPTLGNMAFQELVPLISGIGILLKASKPATLSLLSDGQLTTLRNDTNQLQTALAQMRDFSLNIDNMPQMRDRIVNNVRGGYEQFISAMTLPMCLLSVLPSGEAELISKYVHEAETSSKKISDIESQAAATLEAARSAAAEIGVTRHSQLFAEDANSHRQAATKWALATGALFFLTVGWGVLALWYIPIAASETVAMVVQQAIAKLIVFSGLSYALLWCARNYTANQHNYIVSKHRANSLGTFEAFVRAAAGDEDTKNAVLLQATSSIFSAQPSGYSAKEPEVEQPTKVVEILRSSLARGDS